MTALTAGEIELMRGLQQDGATVFEAISILEMTRHLDNVIELAKHPGFNPAELRDKRGRWTKGGSAPLGSVESRMRLGQARSQPTVKMSPARRQQVAVAHASPKAKVVGGHSLAPPGPVDRKIAAVTTQANTYADVKAAETHANVVAKMTKEIEAANQRLKEAAEREDTHKHRAAFVTRVGTLIAGFLLTVAELKTGVPELPALASFLVPNFIMETILLAKKY